jgi:CBS domain-containing protein
MTGHWVKDYMVQKKERVEPKDAVITAIELMVEKDVGSVLVVDQQDRVVGIFTERDLLRHYLEGQSRFLYLTVEEVMSSPVVHVRPETSLAEALDLMTEKDIRHLPVLDRQDHCVGFLTWKNLFRHFSNLIKEAPP